MSAFPEMPANLNDEQDLTVAALATDCESYAERDEKFAYRKRLETGIESNWTTDELVSWRVGFLAIHCWGNGRYEGYSYQLSLTVSQEMDAMCPDLQELAAESGQELPEEVHIHSVEVTHRAEYIISRYDTLGWTIQREYEIHHDQDDIGPSIEDLYDIETLDECDSLEGDDVTAIKSLGLVRYIAYREPPVVTDELEPGDPCGDEFDIMACLETEVYLRQARQVFDIFDAGDEGDFDLTTIFPPEIIKAGDE